MIHLEEHREIEIFVHTCSNPNNMIFDKKRKEKINAYVIRITDSGIDVEVNGTIYFVFNKRPSISQSKNNLSWFKSEILTLN